MKDLKGGILMFSLPAALFLLGFALLAIELFVPGFGVPGILGLCSIMIASLIVAETYGPLAVVAILIIIIILCFIIFKIIKKNKVYTRLVLEDQLDAQDFDENSICHLMGREGVTIVPLKPYGKVDFDGFIVDVFSNGEYISKGKLVRVICINGKNVTVKAI